MKTAFRSPLLLLLCLSSFFLATAARAVTVVSISADCASQQITIVYSAPVANDGDPFHYNIDQGVTISAVTFSSDQQTAILDVASISACVTYQLAITGITDLAGTPLVPDPMLVAFQCATPPRPPVITSQPANVAACPGAKVVLAATVTGDTPMSFQWYLDNVPIPGATGSTYAISSVGTSDVGTYYLAASNSCGGTASSNAAVTLRAPLTASGPADRAVCVGSPTTFSTKPSTTGSVAYQWTKDGTNIPKATNASYTINSAGSGNAGVYCVIVRGLCNSVTNCATLTVETNLAPLTVVSAPSDCLSNKVVLTFSKSADAASAQNPLAYLLNPNLVVDSAILLDPVTVCLGFSPATPMVAGLTYTLVAIGVKDLCGNANPAAAPITFSCSAPSCLSLVCPPGVVVPSQGSGGTGLPDLTPPVVLLDESFNAGNGGFTVETVTPFEGSWLYDQATGRWRADGQDADHASPMTTILASPPVTATESGPATVQFRHRWSFEFDGSRWDGGQLQVSVNGGPFLAVPDSAFSQGGYGGKTITAESQAVLAGQPAFTATSPGHETGELVTSEANLGSFKPGNTVRVRFFYSADTNTRGAVPNWEIDSLRIRQSKDPVVVVNNCGIPFQLQCLPPLNGLFPPGVTTVNCVATNDQGAMATCRFPVTVGDITPPDIHCPADLRVTAANQNGAMVTFSATATDGPDTIVAVNCTPPSPSLFPIGVTTVNCSATDQSGNTNSCSFTVTVDSAGPCVRSNKGTDFWLTFPVNYPDPINPQQLSLCLVGPPDTTGTVEIIDPPFVANFIIPPSMSTKVLLPPWAEMKVSDAVRTNGIHVVASAKVGVFALNHIRYTTDGYLGLPTPALGTHYIVQSYANTQTDFSNLAGTQFAMVACDNQTTVTIVPAVSTGPRTAGMAYKVKLNKGQTYQLRNTDDAPADLSGTLITSDKPIAVFGGHTCANINSPSLFFCDYLVEQLLPTTTWGMNFVTVPLATRKKGDTFRITASANNTTVSVNNLPVATLNQGQTHQVLLAAGAQITANAPISVMQYANSSDFDGVTDSDPFMVTVPPTTLFLDNQMICTAEVDFPVNYLNLVVPSLAVGGVRMDGVPVPTTFFAPIGLSGYSGAQVPVTVGPHNLSAPLAFGVTVYGWNEFDAYAWPGGLGFENGQPPSLICPADQTVSVDAHCHAEIPDLTREVTISDFCEPAGTVGVSQDPAPGTPVGPGSHLITFTAPDATGTVLKCQMNFTVLDPLVTVACPPDQIVETNERFGKRVFFETTVEGGCAVGPAICQPPSGSQFPPGITTVTCAAGDPLAPNAECSFTVRVILHTVDITISGKNVSLCIISEPDVTYLIEANDSIAEPHWELIRAVRGTGGKVKMEIPIEPKEARFFRVRVQ